MTVKKKRLSLADRILAGNATNTPKEEQKKEQNILAIVTSPSTQTTKQPSNRATEHLPEHVPEHVPEHLPEQPSNRTTEQVPEQPSNRTTEQVPEQPSNRATEQAPGQPSNRATEQPNIVNESKKPTNLKINQFKILHYIYFCRPFKVKGPNGLSGILNIKYGTVRNSLNSLIRKGYINKPFSINDGVNNGSTCIVNEVQCLKLFGPTEIEQPSNRATEQVPEQPSNRATKQVPEQPNNRATEQVPEQAKISYNKLVSKFLNKLTNFAENSILLQNKGFTEKKFKQWIEEEKADPQDLYLQLQIAEHIKEIQKPKKSALSCFYKVAVQGAGFEPPAGFKTIEQKKLERIKEQNEIEQKLIMEETKKRFITDSMLIEEIVTGYENHNKPMSSWLLEAKKYREDGTLGFFIKRELEKKWNIQIEGA
ncbi:MAG: hypothetical protein GY710_26605 [Desulfobacteraceae bacterium]|nr:hypothetical protein [Desulfobacteraceae bacterium]